MNFYDVNEMFDDMTALMVLSYYNFYECISVLLSNDDVDPNIQNSKGYTALHYACMNSSENATSILMSNKSVNPNIQDRDGLTPIFHIIKNNHPNLLPIMYYNPRVVKSVLFNGKEIKVEEYIRERSVVTAMSELHKSDTSRCLVR